MQKLAPIALFVYRRADLVDRVLDALELCPEFSASEVFVYSDGPRDEAAVPDVEQVRATIKRRQAGNIRLIEATANRGLAASIIAGVTDLCSKHGRVIVIEDDLIASSHLLTWFNSALDAYADDPRVMQVSGHVFGTPVSGKHGFFAPITTSWGWATWDRAWKAFDADATGWERLLVDGKLRRRFDFDNTYPFTKMMRKQRDGKVNSWAIRWYWSVFQAGGLVAYPPQTLVLNVGNDGRATHQGLRNLVKGWLGVRAVPGELSGFAPVLPSRVDIDSKAVRGLQGEIRASRSLWLALRSRVIGSRRTKANTQGAG